MSGDQEVIELNGFWLSRDLFEMGYPSGGGPCQCSSACCSNGVHLDLLERDCILAHAAEVKTCMDESQTADESQWFDSDEMEDSDYPSGKAVATAVIGNKCVFLNGMGRCTLQLAAVDSGMDKWAIKPLYCILYPIVVQNNVVIFDDLLQEEQSCCSVGATFQTPLFEACGDELRHLFGAEGYERIQSHYRDHYSKSIVNTPQQDQS